METQRLRVRRVINHRSEFDPDCISCTPPENDALAFAATRFWKAVLHPDQTVPGALLLTSLRHVSKVSALTEEESSEWFALYRAVETALEVRLGAALVNVSCERNWAYRAGNPDPPLKGGKPNPHVHWHVAPRYSSAVSLGDESFDDVDFGGPLVWSARRPKPATASLLMDEVFEQIAAHPAVTAVSAIDE